VKAFLLFSDSDLDLSQPLPPTEPDLAQDLELDVLLKAMARGDEYLYSVARSVLHASLLSAEQIAYRQDILSDCIRHPAAAFAIYNLAVEAIQAERSIWGSLFSSPSSVLHRSMQVMELSAVFLRRLRALADEQAGQFSSAGFRRLFDMLRSELDDAYFAEISDHLRRLKFKNGLLISARLDATNKGSGYVLRRLPDGRPGLRSLLPSGARRPGSVLVVADRDMTGQQTLSNLRDKGTNLVASALAQSCEHIRSFFDMLRREVGFYVGCLNLRQQLHDKGLPLCMPTPLPVGKHALAAASLYDPCLALTTTDPVVGNDVQADGKALVMITGANQGGKSTFLRSIGLAQLMMQSGMFVPAESMATNVSAGIFTHYKRAEDATMTSGKLDEELARMSDITDAITPGGLLLCNESFASTNEREGSHISRNIVRAMLDSEVKVFFVTHFYDLAHGFYADERHDALFLRAGRQADGGRTYRLTEGEPLPTGHARDVYQHVFGASLRPASGANRAGGASAT
jgi:MutS domain V